jgi:hypothetical protein
VGEDDHAAGSREDDCEEDDLSCVTSVWWSWTAPTSGLVNVNLCRSGFDTTLGVHAGDSVGGLTEIASNDDIDPTVDEKDETTSALNCPANRTASGVDFPASAGVTYRIAVAGYAGATGAVDGRIGAGGLGTLPPNPGRCSNRSLGSGRRDTSPAPRSATSSVALAAATASAVGAATTVCTATAARIAWTGARDEIGSSATAATTASTAARATTAWAGTAATTGSPVGGATTW